MNLYITLRQDEPLQVEVISAEPAPGPTPEPKTGQPVKTQLVLGGPMGTGAPGAPATITVDTTNETVSLQFVDDKGDVTNAPEGATVTFTSSDPNVATVANDPNNPLQGDITPVGVGTIQLSATVAGANDASGNPLPNPDPASLTVNPGAPAGERLTVA